MFCSLDSSLFSYTMDVFNSKDQVFVMTGKAGAGGLGGIAGFFLSSKMPTYSLPLTACLYGIFTILHVLSKGCQKKLFPVFMIKLEI